MSALTSLVPTTVPDPFALALRYATAPYAQGTATLTLGLGPAGAGVSDVLPYDFSTFQTQYGIQLQDIVVSYLLTLQADQLSGPSAVDIDYATDSGPGTVHLLVPSGSLAGTSFAVAPLPSDPSLFLQKLTEHPAPGPAQPAGPGKWSLTALLGNLARLLWVISGESQVLASTARDVKAQVHLLTARGGSLDHIGADLGVPRLLPAPYRLDLDPDTVALYHLDDPIAPLLDAAHDYPGVNIGAKRGVPGRFGGGCQVTSNGGLVVPDALAFVIDPTIGFTVEMFAELAAAPGANETVVFAVKRPRFDQSDSPGWSLALEPTATGHDLAFTLTDTAGNVIRTAAANPALPAGWFHVAGVVNPGTKQAVVYLNGVAAATAPLGALGVVETGADIGLGADRTGVAHLNGSLDEVRFSATARTDFSSVLGAGAKPYPVDDLTISLYHMDETDDWIDEDLGAHFAVNRGATRGAPARFNAGLLFTGDPLPVAHCASERDFQAKLRAGTWDRSAGGAVVGSGPYTRFGYRQGAIAEPGLTSSPEPVLVNDSAVVDPSARGLLTTACYGFAPADPNHPNAPSDPSQTIAAFQAAGRSVQEAIDYFGEWFGLGASYFQTQYQAHQITAAHETCQSAGATPSSVLIPGSASFAFDATTSFTVEAFIRPIAIADDYARAVAASRSSGLRVGEANAGEAGWALCLGPYRSIPNNLRWVVGDAAGNLVTVDANLNLADGAFHHVAGVVDRGVGVALLFVDGVEVNQSPLAKLGVAATNGDITLGNSPKLDAPFAGLIDEVRISSAARRLFQPVLGEGDDRYRQRLAIFQPWRLPSYGAILRGVQALTLSDPSQVDVTSLLLGSEPIPANLVQFVVDETDSTRFCASTWLRVIPEGLTPGQSIAANGTTPATEPAVTALANLPSSSPALLSEPDGTNYTFTTPQSRMMVLATAKALERFAARLHAVAPSAKLSILSAYQVAQPAQAGQAAPVTNDGLGLALTLVLAAPVTGLDLGVLGALAFETGIAYVAYENDPVTPFLRLVVAPGADLQLEATGSNPGLDPQGRQIAVVNQPLTIAITRPKPQKVNGQAPPLDWILLRCGPGNGSLTPAGTDNSVMTFTGSALGVVTIEVRYPLPDGITVLIGSLQIVVAPLSLDGCDILGGDGTADVTEDQTSGAADPSFLSEFLIQSAVAGVDYAPTVAPEPASNLMQIPLDSALAGLARLAAKEPGSPRITVLSAYDPNASNLQSVGRGMVIAPSAANLTAARLGALAFLAGFSYIERRRYPPSVYVSVPQGNLFQVVSGPLRRLWPNARISGRGDFMATEFDAAGPPDANFNPGILQAFNDPRAAFVAGVSNLVQPVLATALTAMLSAIAADGAAGVLQVIGGYKAQDPSLLGVGRALLFRHPSVAADRLSGYALQAGFGFVQHRTLDPGGPAVYAAAYPSTGPPPNLLVDSDSNYVNVYQNTLIELGIRPRFPVKGRLDWCLTPACPAAANLSAATPDPSDPPGITEKVFQGTAPGAVAATATFSLNDFSEPFQFLVEPAGSGGDGAPQPRITKDQYDDLLNFLDAYHPAGVEGVTRGIRAYVHGFQRPPRWDRLPTAATFPRYRANPS